MPAQSPTLSPTLSAIIGRVARVVLRDPRLDLAHEVGADVGRLREDAAAESGEDRDQRAAEAQADERVDRGLLAVAEDRRQQAVVAGDAEQREADDEQAGDRAAAEGHRAAPARRRRGRPRRRARWRAPRRSCRCSRPSPRASPPMQKPQATAMFWMKISATNSDHADERRSSCTGDSGRRARPAGRRARSPACARCPARAPAGIVRSRGRTPRRRLRIRGRRRPHGSSESCSTEILRGLICVPREDFARTFGDRTAQRSACPVQTRAESIVPARRRLARTTLSCREPTAGRSPAPARARRAPRPGAASPRPGAREASPPPGSPPGRRRARPPARLQLRRVGHLQLRERVAQRAHLLRDPPLEDLEQRPGRVDRVADLLEVARGGTWRSLSGAAAAACARSAGGPSRRAAMFNSDTVAWAIMSVLVILLSSAS